MICVNASEFSGKLVKVLWETFGIKKVRISAFHPQSNIVQRVHRCLKAMIRAAVDDCPDRWIRVLPLSLFAYREVPVESCGFNPVELMFGRTARGPLTVIKEAWTTSSDVERKKCSVIEYMLSLCERLTNTIDIANKQEVKSKEKKKSCHDKKTVIRNFCVLLFSSIPDTSLDAKYVGAFTILDRVGPVDYIIATPECRKSK